MISDIVYKLALPPHWKIHNIFHALLLTPYHETLIHGSNHHKPPPDVINGEPEWEVDEVIGLRTFGRCKEKQYRIRWKGYSPAHDTWEPAANVHTPELIQDSLKKEQGRHKNPTMSDEDLPTQLNLIAMNPDTTGHPSTPPSPSSITTLLYLAARAGVEVTEQEAAVIKAIRVQEEEPQNATLSESPAYSLTSPTPEASRPTTPDLTYPGPDPVHHSQINISPDIPVWPWMERRRYPNTASVPY